MYMCGGRINGYIKTNMVWNNSYQVRYEGTNEKLLKILKVFFIKIMFQHF